jgi:hypothetical protein
MKNVFILLGSFSILTWRQKGTFNLLARVRHTTAPFPCCFPGSEDLRTAGWLLKTTVIISHKPWSVLSLRRHCSWSSTSIDKLWGEEAFRQNAPWSSSKAERLSIHLLHTHSLRKCTSTSIVCSTYTWSRTHGTFIYIYTYADAKECKPIISWLSWQQELC